MLLIMHGASIGSGMRQDGPMNHSNGHSPQSAQSPHITVQDDRQPDSTMPYGSHPRHGIHGKTGNLWSSTYGQPRDESSSAASASSIAVPNLRSIDEMSNLDEESLRKIADRVTKALAPRVMVSG